MSVYGDCVLTVNGTVSYSESIKASDHRSRLELRPGRGSRTEKRAWYETANEREVMNKEQNTHDQVTFNSLDIGEDFTLPASVMPSTVYRKTTEEYCTSNRTGRVFEMDAAKVVKKFKRV